MAKKRKKVPSIITIGILTTITVFLWIFFEVYRILSSTPPVDVPPDILAPFSSDLDSETINSLKEKTDFDDNYLKNYLPVISPTLPATNSASINGVYNQNTSQKTLDLATNKKSSSSLI